MAGRRIDDHAAWCGSRGRDMVLPEGCKTKAFRSAEGAGELGRYEDTSEAIHSMQEAGIRKAKGHDQPSDERN